ncbi:MAG: PEGA domain-containing protein, partial [Calditrichota bacterium]
TEDEAEKRKKQRRKKKSSGYHSYNRKVTRKYLINIFIISILLIGSVVLYKLVPTPTVGYGTLIISTDLPGGEIFLNAQKLNKFTPDTLRKVKAGNYYVSVFKEGYNIYPPMQMVSVRENKSIAVDFSVHSISRNGQVKINFNVPDAQLYVDGLPFFLGSSGLSEIPEGFHTLMLVKRGYITDPVYHRVFINPAETTEVSFNFIPDEPLSYLKVSDNLSAGSIYLNGKYTGMQASGNLLPVRPGLYEVKVLKNGYITDPETHLIELAEGDERLIVFHLEAAADYFPVEIKSVNPGAIINIDGEYLPFVTPMKNLSLSSGTHHLALCREENGIQEQETIIKVGPKSKNCYSYSF